METLILASSKVELGGRNQPYRKQATETWLCKVERNCPRKRKVKKYLNVE